MCSAQRDFSRPFDLSKDSPLRFTVARVSADELMLLITAHHIAWDDGSWAPFFTDLTARVRRSGWFCRRTHGAGPYPDPASDEAARRDADLDYWRPLMTIPRAA